MKISKLSPVITTNQTTNKIEWEPRFIDYDASLFYRGKTITNAEFNSLFLQGAYQCNYIADSLVSLLDQLQTKFLTDVVNLQTDVNTKMDKNNPTGTGTFSLTGNQEISGTSQASGFKTPSGTSNEFLKANGTTDNTVYQPANDNNLNTSFKNIVGAINEIKAGTDSAISSINSKIPSDASSNNKFVTVNTMNSSISTATATFKGSFNLVNDLNLTITATEGQIATALAAATSSEDNNDYAFVKIPTANDTPTLIDHTDRYKFNGSSWAYEYTLNTSGFTAAQWEALNSGITQDLVDTYITYEEVEELDPSVPAPIVTAVSNPNLLVNGDFRVNQRGQSTYTSGYTVDRWKMFYGNTTVDVLTNGNIKLTASGGTWRSVGQYIENYKDFFGKTLTFTANYNSASTVQISIDVWRSGTRSTLSYSKTDTTSGNFVSTTTTATIPNDGTITQLGVQIFVQQQNGYAEIAWAKLELGSVATMFCPKPYAEELAACQMPFDNKGISTVFSNPNLLVNGDFQVNQRGQASYTFSGSKIYTVDRWRLSGVAATASNVTVTPKTNGITLTMNTAGTTTTFLINPIEELDKLRGKTVTASISTPDGIKSVTYTIPSSGTGGTSATTLTTGLFFRIYTQPAFLEFTIDINKNFTGSYDIYWAKLEVGSVATPFSPSPYAEELPKCMRYFQIRSSIYTIETKAGDRPIPMRVDGTIGTTTIGSTTYNSVDAEIY